MNLFSLKRLTGVALLSFAASTLLAATEPELLAILQSQADIPTRCEACRQLRVTGSAAAVPALAAVLGEDRLSHAARYALEGIPGPEPAQALRDGLSRTTGRNKAGVIASLGALHDQAAQKMIAPLLLDPDPEIATAAAGALGNIGGPTAAESLSAARPRVAPAVQARLLDALLLCADGLLASGDAKSAAKLYASLADPACPAHVRLAAWRGQLKANPAQRADRILAGLTGSDPALRSMALVALREETDPNVFAQGLRQWKKLPAEAQVTLLRFNSSTPQLPTAIRLGAASEDMTVRTAAWQAAAEANDFSQIPALATVAAGPAPERDAAREALARLHGAAAEKALLKALNSGTSTTRAEVARALGERGDVQATGQLLHCATNNAHPVRSAALEALRKVGAPDSLVPLLQIAAQSGSDEAAAPALRAASAVAQRYPDKTEATTRVLAALGRFGAPERRRVLPLLSDLGTPSALTALLTDTRSADRVLAREAVDVLAQWPTAAAAEPLLEIARTSGDPATHSQALQGAIAVSPNEPDATRRLGILHDSLSASRRPAEKKMILSQLGDLATPAALELALTLLPDPELANEAGLAALAVAAKLAPSNSQLAAETADRVLAQVKTPAVIERAWALRGQNAGSGLFIRDWLVSGPYRQPGADGALAVFPVAFAPEKGEAANWKALPPADSANLMGAFPAEQNCAAYLKARLLVPSGSDAMLLLGSDDGVKAWLNGEVVHTNNVDRGQVADQDRVPIHLNAGTNELLLKITQGGGGWSACARIVGVDGKPLPGLRVEPQRGAPIAAPAPKPAVAAVPSTLPPRDHYRKLRLTDKFHAEGAYYADFNGDGKTDIVAGPFWFAGPDFQQRHEYRPIQTFNPATEYSDNFLTFAGDCNGDGRPDILCAPFPGKEGYWYENPGQAPGHWKRHLAYDCIGNESPRWGEITAGSGPQLLFCNNGFLGYAGPDRANPEQPWKFHAISQQDKRYQRFTHGVGFGDVNGDHRTDAVESIGWWEQPASLKEGEPWLFHPAKFAEAGAQMLVDDVDGDGAADVITTWHCHAYGLLWWRQIRGADGKVEWKQNVILPPEPNLASADFRVSQLHALQLVDMNGDGLKDILTGKRFWSHGPTGDKEPDAPAVIFWLQLQRGGPDGATFLPHLIDDDSGVGTQVEAVDLNADGRPDPLVSNKKGIFIHLSLPAAPAQ